MFHVEHMNDLSTICPNHPNESMRSYGDINDHFLSKEKFQVHECTKCGLLRTWPIPTNLGKYYETEEYLSHGAEKAGLFAKAYRAAKGYNLGTKARLFKSLNKNGSVLDYGCGTGDLMAHLQAIGFTVSGAEPSAIATANAPNHIRENIKDPDDELRSSSTYDIISLFHVLEHIPHPQDIISQLKSKLNAGGHLIIAVPNPTSFDAHQYGKYWAAWDVPRHLWHFTPKAMIQMITSLGLEHRSSHPMWLDAFYVSLLSERYKGGFAPKAILIALLSNLKALLRKKTACSSQIYVFQNN